MERRLPPNEQPGALKVRAGVKLVSTILAASTACHESRLGTTSGNGYYTRMFEPMALERRVLDWDLFHGLHLRDAGFALGGKYIVLYCTKVLE